MSLKNIFFPELKNVENDPNSLQSEKYDLESCVVSLLAQKNNLEDIKENNDKYIDTLRNELNDNKQELLALEIVNKDSKRTISNLEKEIENLNKVIESKNNEVEKIKKDNNTTISRQQIELDRLKKTNEKYKSKITLVEIVECIEELKGNLSKQKVIDHINKKYKELNNNE